MLAHGRRRIGLNGVEDRPDLNAAMKHYDPARALVLLKRSAGAILPTTRQTLMEEIYEERVQTRERP
jgi:hypothetical protein